MSGSLVVENGDVIDVLRTQLTDLRDHLFAVNHLLLFTRDQVLHIKSKKPYPAN